MNLSKSGHNGTLALILYMCYGQIKPSKNWSYMLLYGGLKIIPPFILNGQLHWDWLTGNGSKLCQIPETVPQFEIEMRLLIETSVTFNFIS